MHDIDRGGGATAARLAALAALRKAQADGTLLDDDDTDDAETSGGPAGRSRALRARPGNAAAEPDPAPRLSQEMSAGVFAAVEAAVRRSRIEFVTRLMEYRKKLDFDALESTGPDSHDVSMDEAQFIAHRIAGVGKTLGFGDLGDAARQTEVAIGAYKLERSAELRKTTISRICTLAGLIETVCAENGDCLA